MAGIFISYRRDDSDVAAGRLADDLSKIFGADSIFRDVDQLVPGEDYEVALDRALDSCEALIAVIGPHWSSIATHRGLRRLEDPKDWVRTEIGRALKRGIRVIPVLIGTSMPRDAEMPDDLKPLLRRQACDLGDRHWKQDLELIAQALKKIPGVVPRAREEESGADARQIYRALVADLRNLDSEVHALGALSGPNANGRWFVIRVQTHSLEVAAERVCNARRSVSELGDRSTREELDKICKFVETIKVLSETTQDGVGGAALAKVFDDLGAVKQLREELGPRT